jgi:hypothetical protein
MEKVMARELASDIEDIARTIAELALPGMRPKDLVDAVRKKHAAASKKRNMSGRLLRGYSGR